MEHMTTEVPQESIAIGQMGDCLLHRTHHPMDFDCWGVVIGFFLDRSESRDRYKWHYEQACLADIVLEDYEAEL